MGLPEKTHNTELLNFLTELVQIQSYNPPGDEQAIAEVVARKLEEAGLKVELVSLGGKRANVVGHLHGSGQRPALLLCGHLDTVPSGNVPWKHDPLSAHYSDGHLYGRGTVDMKAGVAAIVFAACAAVRSGWKLEGDLIVLGTAGEEVDLVGARAFREAGRLADVGAIAIPEPTNLDLVIGHRGALWLRLVTHGKAAHGSMPEQGVNAINHMLRLLERLERVEFPFQPHPLFGLPSMNVGTISGGVKTNVVADYCEATVDLRTLPGQDHQALVTRINHLIAELTLEIPNFNAKVQIIHSCPAVVTPLEAPLVQKAKAIGQKLWGRELPPRGASYYTDASVLALPQNIPTIILGPGKESLAHQVDEYVRLEQVITCAEFYTQLIQAMLA